MPGTTENLPSTVGDLRASGYRTESVKEEMRRNARRLLAEDPDALFPGIVGYQETVEPQLLNAVLARHDILLLGLRGQAKTRLARSLTSFLDERVPVLKGSEINDDPLAPISSYGRKILEEFGDDAPIEWIGRDDRYGEKLATPDVTIADLIGDVDPVKVATRRLTFADEEAIHFGIIPRTNRGIFVINELPDLQPRIQVGLFNIMQERDIQIRGFRIRIPLDIVIVFTANPQDYTNRGAIITPLKDRIDSQILTHYPRTLEDGIAITRQEADLDEEVQAQLVMPQFVEEIVEMTAAHARSSDFVDQAAGVSVRMTVSTTEAMIANAERRAIILGEKVIVPRLVDLQQALTGMTGKTELVFEGEQEGPLKVARLLIGKGVRAIFAQHLPDPLQKTRRKSGQTEVEEKGPYDEILAWFSTGNTVTLHDTMPSDEFYKCLKEVPTLADLATQHLGTSEADKHVHALAMEFILEGLHHSSKIAKEEGDAVANYRDMVGSIFSGGGYEEEDESGYSTNW